MSTDMPPDHDTAVDRMWAAVANVEGIGLALLVAGGTLVTQAVVSTGAGGWLEPLRAPAIVPFIAGLLAGAAILWTGVIWQRYGRTDVADAVTGRGRLTGRTLPTVGATSMLAGVVTMVAVWFLIQTAGPTGSVVLSPGAKTEAFQSRVAGEEIDVMLPLRLHLENVQLKGAPGVKVAFSTPGEDPFGQRKLMAGESVKMEGYRLAPIGLSAEEGSLEATIRSRREKTIPATVGSGETVKLSPDGAEYTVVKVVKNYIDAVGPAVQLESEKQGRFWVFTAADAPEDRPNFEHDLYVDSLQRSPGVLFSVTPGFPLWPIGLGGSLFIVGLALVMAFPEQVRRPGGTERDLESFNELGALTEEDGDEEVG